MTQTLDVDVAIIGAGTAGMAAYEQVAKETDRVVVIDAGPWGTTCARVGCMPSKLLIAAASAAHAVAQARVFGIETGAPKVDGAAVMARVRSERDRYVASVLKAVESWPAAHRVTGHARFIDDHTLAIDAAEVGAPTRIHAARIVIATGASPVRPPDWCRALGRRLLTHDEIFDWPTLPASVAVVGAGPLGLELAQALHRLQVRVRLYDAKNQVGTLSSPALQAQCRDIFGQALPLTLGADDLQVDLDADENGNAVRVRCHGSNAPGEHFELLLAAVGRRAHVQALGLSNTSLPLDEHGVPVFNRHSMQVGALPVFIAGDAAADWPVLHEAADEGRIAGAAAASFPRVRKQTRRTRMQVVFSSPQLATAGQGFEALTQAGVSFEVGRVSYADQGRAQVMAVNQGALEVYGEPGTGRLLGAEMVGPAAEHIAHLLAWSVERGDTVQQMLSYPYYHPTLEEGLRTALRELRQALHLGPQPNTLDCGPGS
jgi:dihydrolipoamide dehydrogenase